MENKIIIYTSETCGHCKNIKEALDKENIKFTEVKSNEKQEDWNKVSNLTGLSVLPTVVVNDSYLIPSRDFHTPEQLVAIINNTSPDDEDFSTEVKLIEGFKTLTHSINRGFGAILQELQKIKEQKNEG